MKKYPDIKTHYLKEVFDMRYWPKTMKNAEMEARVLKMEHNFDTIVFSGISGAALGFSLSHLLDIPALLVRKPKENSHYMNEGGGFLEGHLNTNRYLIVDDMICSGNTMNHIIGSIYENNPLAQCVCIMLYAL